MKYKKTIIFSLLTVSFLSLFIFISPLLNKNTKHNNTNYILGALVSIPCLSLAGYLLWSNKLKQDQEKINYLRTFFLELIRSTEGKINNLQFSAKINAAGKIHISGEEATLFLKKMIEEFNGDYFVSQQGSIYYVFDLGATFNEPFILQEPPLSSISPELQPIKDNQERANTSTSQKTFNEKLNDEHPLDPTSTIQQGIKTIEDGLNDTIGKLFK